MELPDLPDFPEHFQWPLVGLCAASLMLNIGLLMSDGEAVPSAQGVAQVGAQGSEAMAVVSDASSTSVDLTGIPEHQPLPDGIERVHASVSHSLARTFQKASPDRGNVLSAIYARLFFWDLDLRADLQKGDQVRMAYTWDGELAEIAVATFKSKKHKKTYRAYRFQRSGDGSPSYWNEDGVEVGRRLKNSPLADYEQVTSLLKDRPTHKGMDFKVNVGQSVVSPKSGKVTKANWNLKYNGNCVEVQFEDGVKARFLHLSETAVKAGQYVKAGERIGATGNTGRSTAPHLHYEMDRRGKIIDPVDYHGTTRRELPMADTGRFDEKRRALDGILDVEA